MSMTPSTTIRALASAVLGAAVLAGCSSPARPPDTGPPPPPRTASPSPDPPTPTPTPPSPPASPEAEPTRVTKMLVFVIENKSPEEVAAGMPWLGALADAYGRATDFLAITHPSEPNYIAMLGGDTFGIADNGPPSSHSTNEPSVFGDAVRNRGTARLYAEDMPGNCALADAEQYVVKHNPWAFFESERGLCRAGDVSFSRFAADVSAGDLPTVGMVVPNQCHNAHDCPIGEADAWLRDQVGAVLAGPDFAAGRLAVVITADEDDREGSNHVLTVVVHPSVHQQVVDTELSHYSVSRSFAEVAGVAPRRNAGAANSLLAAFGLTAGR